MNIEDVASRIDITDVLHKYCRGMDRMDRELTRSCWHDDGTDDHAPLFVGSADAFLDWLWPVHADMDLTRHRVTNVLIDLRGDQAGVESYWEVTFRTSTSRGLVDTRSGGRYVDTFERREGIWAISHRRSIREWTRVDPVHTTVNPGLGQAGIVPNNPDACITTPQRNRNDYSYQILSG